MSADEQTEQTAADDDGVELPADEPGATDEPGPSDDEQAAEAEEAEPTPEPEPEPEARGLSEREWEDRFKKAEQRFATYARAIGGIFEEEANDLIPCPLCLGPVRGFVYKAQAGRVPQEQADLVKHFLGLARPADYPQSSEHKACEECSGLGKVTTGSQVPGNETINCATCRGYGFVPPPGAPQNGAGASEEVRPLLSVASADTPQDDPDEWGEPKVLPNGMENPNYGRMPHRKILVEPWGHTAGLTAQDAVPAGGS